MPRNQDGWLVPDGLDLGNLCFGSRRRRTSDAYAQPTDDDEAAPSGRAVGAEIVGRRLRVWWPDDDAWYAGRAREPRGVLLFREAGAAATTVGKSERADGGVPASASAMTVRICFEWRMMTWAVPKRHGAFEIARAA